MKSMLKWIFYIFYFLFVLHVFHCFTVVGEALTPNPSIVVIGLPACLVSIALFFLLNVFLLILWIKQQKTRL